MSLSRCHGHEDVLLRSLTEGRITSSVGACVWCLPSQRLLPANNRTQQGDGDSSDQWLWLGYYLRDLHVHFDLMTLLASAVSVSFFLTRILVCASWRARSNTPVIYSPDTMFFYPIYNMHFHLYLHVCVIIWLMSISLARLIDVEERRLHRIIFCMASTEPGIYHLLNK